MLSHQQVLPEQPVLPHQPLSPQKPVLPHSPYKGPSRQSSSQSISGFHSADPSTPPKPLNDIAPSWAAVRTWTDGVAGTNLSVFVFPYIHRTNPSVLVSRYRSFPVEQNSSIFQPLSDKLLISCRPFSTSSFPKPKSKYGGAFPNKNDNNNNNTNPKTKSKYGDAFPNKNDPHFESPTSASERSKAFLFLLNSFQNIFNKKGGWTQTQAPRKRGSPFRFGKQQQQQQQIDDAIGLGISPLLFPENDLSRQGLVLKRKDFLQLFGDRTRAKLEPPWRAVFFGSDDFSVQVLRLLHGAGFSLVPGDGLLCSLDVCTNVGKKGTENPVYRYAVSHGLNVIPYPIPKDQRLEDYDVGLLASFGHLVPTRLIQSYPYGILNVHPSLLPRWRGASPCIHTVLNGDAEAGVTIMQVAPKHFDIGPIV